MTERQQTDGLRFMVCPDCSAAYPTFYSPTGSHGTFCSGCGWTSDEEAAEAAARYGAPKEER